MAKVIEFYVPDKFRQHSKWIPPKQRGKVIQFPALQKKSALRREVSRGWAITLTMKSTRGFQLETAGPL